MHRIDSTRSIRASALKSFAGRESAGTIPPEVCELCFSDLVQPVDAKASSAGTRPPHASLPRVPPRARR